MTLIGESWAGKIITLESHMQDIARKARTDGFTRRSKAPIPAILRQLAEEGESGTDGFTRRKGIRTFIFFILLRFHR